MQLLVDSSMEDGFHEGLAWISGDIKKLTPKNNLSIPHVGWNDIYKKSSSPIFFGIHDEHHFFFDHSYHYVGDKKFVSATCDYGGNINVAIEHKNIFGVQFHPEKSSISGLKSFQNFTNWIKNCQRIIGAILVKNGLLFKYRFKCHCR